MIHSFDVGEAIKYGVEKAVIINNMRFWLEKNLANKKHFYDNYCWTYNSGRAFSSLFPYLSQQKISRLLRELEEEGVIISANYNQSGYDRTKWYTLPEYSIAQNQNIHCSNFKNGLLQDEQPIPDSKTQIVNTDSKPKDNSAKKTGALDFSCWPYPASEQVFNDWVKLRKAKKAPITQTVVNQVGKELTKAVEGGWTVDDVLTETISSGWSKVCFAWVSKNQNSTKGFNADQARSQIGSFLND